VISPDRGELRYPDPRKLRASGWPLMTTKTAEVMGKQGSDALGLDLPSFRKALQGRRGALKPALMDQSVIAGLENLLTDEILWQARLPPSRVGHGCVASLPRWLMRAGGSRSGLSKVWHTADASSNRWTNLDIVPSVSDGRR